MSTNTPLTQISTVAIGIIQAMQTAHAIYSIVATAMDSVEAQGTINGTNKKAWVMAYAKSIIQALGEHWDSLEQSISQFIDQLKTAYNAVRTLFS